MTNKKPQSHKSPSIEKGKADGPIKWNIKTLYTILVLVAVALYANTIGHHYVLDDEVVIFKNKFTTSGIAGIKNILTTFYWQGYWDFNSGLYRPLSLVLFAIEWQFFPNNPHVGHAVNVILYAATAVLLFSFLTKLLINFPITVPFICTFLFIAHPVHTEVVANIKSGDEILCFLFFISSAIYFLKYIDTGSRSSLIKSTSIFFLCLLSKESGLTFIAVFPLLAYFFREKAFVESLKKTVPFLVPAIVFIVWHEYVISHAGSSMINYTYHDNSLLATPNAMSRLATAIFINGDYLKLLLFPIQLSCDYSFNQIQPVTFMNLQVIVTLVIIFFMGYFIVKNFKKRNGFAFAMLYYLITISLVSNVVYLIGAAKADRFLFAPSLSFCLLMAMAGHQYLKRTQLFAAMLVLFSLYSIKTITRNADWKNNLTLFSKDVKTSSRSANTHYNYGILFMDSVALKARDPEVKKRLLFTSLNELSAAIQIDSLADDAFKELAICYYHLEDYSKAIENSLRSQAINPADQSLYEDLGFAYFRNSNFKEAIDALKKAIAAGFVNSNSYNYLGSSYFKTGDYQSAIGMFNASLEKYPDNDEVLINLGSAYGSLQDFEKAIDSFDKAVLVNPSNPRAYQYLGVIYQEMGDKEKASGYFSKANQISPDPK